MENESYLKKANAFLDSKDPGSLSKEEYKEAVQGFCRTFTDGVQHYSGLLCKCLNATIADGDLPLFREAITNLQKAVESLLTPKDKGAIELFHKAANVTVKTYTAESKEEIEKVRVLGDSVYEDFDGSGAKEFLKEATSIRIPKTPSGGSAPKVPSGIPFLNAVLAKDAGEYADQIRGTVMELKDYLAECVVPDDMFSKIFYASAFTLFIAEEDCRNGGFIDLAEYVLHVAGGYEWDCPSCEGCSGENTEI